MITKNGKEIETKWEKICGEVENTPNGPNDNKCGKGRQDMDRSDRLEPTVKVKTFILHSLLTRGHERR
jgi:hypothetical protein